MKHTNLLILATALSGSASAAVVTNPFVQNKIQNWSHQPGVTVSASSANVPSERGIDGNYDGRFNNGSVTHTANDDSVNSFYQVDLGEARDITNVVLYNRRDCCGGRLQNYSLQASNDANFGSTLYDSGNQAAAAGITARFDTGGVNARYVRVQRNSLANTGGGSVISLAEIDVFGGGATYNFSNIALGSTANQSTTLNNLNDPNASKAIDGNLSFSFNNGGTTHTDPGVNGDPVFWETTFSSLSNINEIALYNRGDCCPDRLSNFRVSIFNGNIEVWGEDYFAGDGYAGDIFSVQEDTGGFIGTGDRVRIELIGGLNNSFSGGADVLSFREVEIYGVLVPEPSSLALLGFGGLALMFRRKK
ncbi:hypothetical protein NT6N_28480 [Oceaniferula spumae]|uniref:F5/8 type C domain-containing protein n=1 Tax=Oceaniferula spumae TaxID=2979115 RepID=A0AAT9FP95_9BACT